MIITITPEDLIKRCLWNNYKKFVLADKSEQEIEKFVENNQPLTITENDAYVIGLLKVVETNNLIHRFKEVINDIIHLKSTIQKIEEEKMVLINKSSILKECISFKEHFPPYFNSDAIFNKNVQDVTVYINEKIKEIDQLETYELIKTVAGKKKKIIFIQSSKLDKLFKLNTVDE